MESSPAAQGRLACTVVERKLDELCASLDGALSPPRPRSPHAERRLFEEIKSKADFLRFLLVAERDCQGGERPEYLVEAEERFAILETAFDQWARRVAGAPAAAEEEEGGCSGSECSCTDSCQEAASAAAGDADRVAVDVTPDAATEKHDSVEEVAPDAVAAEKGDTEHEAVQPRDGDAASDVSEEKRDAVAEHQTAVGTKTISTVQRCWWRRSAAWCGAAGVVAVVAVGLAVELAAVAHHNVSAYVVPT